MSETAITAEEKAAADKAAADAAAAATGEQGKVVLTKEQHDKLVTDAAATTEARRLQGQADARAARLAAALGKGGSHFGAPAEAKPAPTKEEREEYAAGEDRKAAQGLQRLAIDPRFREALDADPTLMGLFQNSPLAVLPLLAPDALDAEDAIGLVTTKLTEKVAAIAAAKAASVVVAPVVKPADTTPPAGIVNTRTTQQNEEYEAARKSPNVENAVAGMIKVGLKSLGGKTSQ